MKLTFELSQASVAEAVKQLHDYQRQLESKTDELCRRLAEEGAEACRADYVPIDTGWLMSGIGVEKTGDSYYVVSEGDYAAFVEFGTGVVGEGTYPGTLLPGYGYNEGQHPSAHDPKDPDAWFYYDKSVAAIRRTKGHAAQPYMLQTAEHMRSRVHELAREVFGR